MLLTLLYKVEVTMALLNTFIDSRTIGGLASNGTATFAHGLPAAPDFVIIQGIVTATGASNAAMALPRYSADATNVTLYATGLAGSDLRVVSIVAHSIIR